MKLKDLSLILAQKTGISQKEAYTFLKLLIQEWRKGLKEDQELCFRGWGTLKVKRTIQGWRFIFHPGQRLRQALNRLNEKLRPP